MGVCPRFSPHFPPTSLPRGKKGVIMYRKQLVGLLLAGLFLCVSLSVVRAAGQIGIKLTNNGLESLTYAGVEYCDPTGNGVLGFTGPVGDEGGNIKAPSVMDAQKSTAAFSPVPTSAVLQGNTITKTYPWGKLAATYTIKGADLYVTVTITNTSATPIGWWKANVLQFNSRLVFDGKPWDQVMPYGYTPKMHWDYQWAMWGGASNSYETWNFTDPHVYWWVDSAAPFDNAPVKIMFADLDPKWQTGVYHGKTDQGDAWPVEVAADGDPGGAPPVAPGQSDTAHIVIRFRPATDSALTECKDGYEAFGRAYPRTVHWTDRRPIGTYFGCRGNGFSKTNPNGWFGDPKVDTTTPEGRKAFATALLADMDTTIAVLTASGAQGMLWWDVEGSRWPQPTTYIGDPRVLDPAHPQHDKYAPELDTLVTYHGQPMKVIDACFKKLHDAGFKTGVTIRPQSLLWKDTAPQQTNEGDAGDLLCTKASYARTRWGCTIFYVDSISEWFGNWTLEKTVSKYPDVLILPEWARTRSYRHSSQFSYTRFTGFTRGVPAEMQACWPDAFCCMGNVDFDKNYDDALYAVQHGNVLLFNCWYQSSEAKKIKQIYDATGVKHIPSALDQQVTTPSNTPASITLHATDEDGNKVTYSILGPPAHGTLGPLDADTGMLTYTPRPGYTGKDLFTFTATDTTGLRANRAKVELTVRQED